MTNSNLDNLATLIEQERDALLSCWRGEVRELECARHLDTPTLNDHIPILLDELTEALRSNSDETIPEAIAEGCSPAHGLQRVHDGYDIEEVVAEYNILRGCIHNLADEKGINLQGTPFHVINRVFDHAIGVAVQTYATKRAMDVQQRREEYLAFVAHDLRTPLNAISLACRVIELTQQNAGVETTQMLKSLRRNVQHLEGLVAKILEENVNLETEMGIKLERRDLDLWPLAEALIYDLHPVAGTDSIKLINAVPGDMVVYADARLLKRILQNLIANAIKYTPRGSVTIGAQDIASEGAIECWVSDDGAGIPEEMLDKVFEKGECDPESVTGKGLGLAIVKSFTEAHGGKVSVESKVGSGTTFRFTLPTRESLQVEKV